MQMPILIRHKTIMAVASVLSLLFLLLGTTSCSRSEKPKDEKMGIVAIMPLTGPVSYLGQQELAGLRVAVDEINASGGINGIQLQLIAEDTQGNPKTAVTIAQKYATTKGISLFVVTTSKAVKAVAPICEEAKIPLAAICSDPDITSLSPIIFRPYMSFESEAALLGDFARSKKWKEVAF